MNLKEMTGKAVTDWENARADLAACSRSNKVEYRKYWKRANARKIRSGYPLTTPLSKEEADSYMACQESICLLCGWTGKVVGSHIAAIHKIELNDYLIAYQLPLTFGLASPEIKAEMSERTSKNEKFIKMREELRIEVRKLAREAHRKAFINRRNVPTYHKKTSRLNVAKAPIPEPLYSDSDYLIILNLMTGNDMTLSEVIDGFDVPQKTAFFAWTKENPDNLRRYRETVEGLSFAAQCRCQSLGERFRKAAAVAISCHSSLADAAESLGVTEMTLWHQMNGGRSKPKA